MRLLRDRLLIRLVEQPNQSEGGVLLPDTAEENKSEGWVAVRGPDCVDDLPVGSKVRVTAFAGIDVEIEREAYIVVRESDVLLVIEEPPQTS